MGNNSGTLFGLCVVFLGSGNGSDDRLCDRMCEEGVCEAMVGKELGDISTLDFCRIAQHLDDLFSQKNTSIYLHLLHKTTVRQLQDKYNAAIARLYVQTVKTEESKETLSAETHDHRIDGDFLTWAIPQSTWTQDGLISRSDFFDTILFRESTSTASPRHPISRNTPSKACYLRQGLRSSQSNPRLKLVTLTGYRLSLLCFGCISKACYPWMCAASEDR